MTKSDTPTLDDVNTTLFNYDQWRIRFLNVVLWVICGLGIFLIIPNIPTISSAELIAFVIVYLSLLIITIAPLPYAVKAGGVITAGYFVSLYTLIRFGPWSDATIFFFVTVLFAALLFDERIDRWVFVINAISLITVAALDIIGSFQVTEPGLPPTDIFIWLTYSADYLVLATISIWAINLLKSEFKNVAEQFRTALYFVNKDRTKLEVRVNERTSVLTRKTEQLRAASYITRQTVDVQNLESILNVVVNLVTDQFGFYHAGIFLMNEEGSEVILQASSSEGGKRMLQKGHSFRLGAKGIVAYAATQKKPRIALDVGTDAVFFDNPDLPNTHSEMALPLLIQDRVLGVIDIQSDQPQAFSVDDIDALQTLADQVAIAIENNRLLEDAQTALMQIEMLTSVRTREAWNKKVKESDYAYTYTPLGMHAGKASKKSDQEINVPINLRGQQIGSISLARKDNTLWSDVDLDMVKEVAYQTGLAVDNVRLVEEATERANQEQTVGELAKRFSQSADIDSLLQIAAREFGQVADVAEVSVYIGQIPEQSPQKRRTKRTSE
ncbi:MAG TPA: GAF domain-containing protein [Anaerolineales bacterium]|nr:GAF domain-containing protein [Anaerolineales bacterium]